MAPQIPRNTITRDYTKKPLEVCIELIPIANIHGIKPEIMQTIKMRIAVTRKSHRNRSCGCKIKVAPEGYLRKSKIQIFALGKS